MIDNSNVHCPHFLRTNHVCSEEGPKLGIRELGPGLGLVTLWLSGHVHTLSWPHCFTCKTRLAMSTPTYSQRLFSEDSGIILDLLCCQS